MFVVSLFVATLAYFIDRLFVPLSPSFIPGVVALYTVPSLIFPKTAKRFLRLFMPKVWIGRER